MALSKIDFLSPKITLYYNGNNSHNSHMGGLLSLFFLIIIILLMTNFIYQTIKPKITSIFIYEENIDDVIYNQTIDYSGINHFIQIYGNSDGGMFGDFDKKNIIIYGMKETSENVYNNDENPTNLSNIEHWIYDKCENIIEINKNLFKEISQIISNYTKSICMRFYYNPKDHKYYEVGLGGYISPNLETSYLAEKKYIYKIVIEKCDNNSIFNEKFNYSCNNNNEIKKYLNLYNNIFLYFSNRQIIPKSHKNPFKKYFHSISSTFKRMSYFESNIIFSPIKIISNKYLFRLKKEYLNYILKNYYQNNIFVNNEEHKTIGIFNFYFRNNLMIYQRKYFTFIECISHIGGTGQVLFFIFQILNYFINNYNTIENTKNLFKINTGIEISNFENNEIVLDKPRHLNSQNFKIKVINNNNIINNEDSNTKIPKNIQSKKTKSKYLNFDYHAFGGIGNKLSTKNLSVLPPIINSHIKKNNYDLKRNQIKYIKTFKQMGKQFSIKNKRKSYMSQGYLIKRKEFKDYTTCSKNQSINENDEINNESPSINNNNYNSSNNINNNNNKIIENNNSNFLLLRETKEKDTKEGLLRHDSKNIGDISRKTKKKKTYLKRQLGGIGTPIFEGGEAQTTIKKISPNIKGRHKSVNFGNQRGDFFLSSGLLGLKNMNMNVNHDKNSSKYVNDSSKQIFINNKSPFQVHTSKFQNEKNKYDEIIKRPSTANNNENNNKATNLNTVIYNHNTEAISYLKTIIQSKIKLIIPEGKQDYILFNQFEKKIKYSEFIKFFFLCNKRKETNIDLINNFRKRLLSEEHLYKTHINLYLLEKIFQIDEQYKFDPYELYNNL